MRFVVDAQLPPALARYLTRRGFPSEHVNRIRLGAADDLAIWNYAAQKDAVLITKDDDFAALARQQVRGPQVVWIRLGNITNAALQAAFDPVLGEIITELQKGERLIEVL